MFRMFLFMTLASAGVGQMFAQISVPSLGLLPDGGTVRPVVGIPAAGSVGDALPLTSQLALTAASRDYALAVAADSGDVLLVTADGTSAKITGVVSAPDLIQLSPQASAAAIYSASAQKVQILTGLPSAPAILREVSTATLQGTPSTLAISDDGNLLAGIWPGGGYLFRTSGDLVPLPAAAPLLAVAFSAGSTDLAMITSADAQILRDSGLARLASFDTPLAATAAALTAQLLIVADSQGNILTFDLSAGTSSSIDCQCTPQGLFPISRTVFRITGLDSGAFKILDTSQSAVWLVSTCLAKRNRWRPAMKRVGLTFLLFTLAAVTLSAQVKINTTALADGYTNGLYYSQTLSATISGPLANTQTLTWSLPAGTFLPPGLNLDASGNITGFPTAPGTYSFIVLVQINFTSYTDQARLTINVIVPRISIATQTPLPDAVLNQPYQQNLQANAVPVLPVQWGVPQAALPPGLTLSAQGVISGIPQATGVYTFPVSAFLANTGVTTTSQFTINVFAGQVHILSVPLLPTALVGQNFSYQLLATPANSTWTSTGILPFRPDSQFCNRCHQRCSVDRRPVRFHGAGFFAQLFLRFASGPDVRGERPSFDSRNFAPDCDARQSLQLPVHGAGRPRTLLVADQFRNAPAGFDAGPQQRPSVRPPHGNGTGVLLG